MTANTQMAMTVLRSPIYAHHDPIVPDEKQTDYRYIDQGLQEFSYRLYPHSGDWRQSSVVQYAEELNQKPITLLETYHEGPLPMSQSFLNVDSEHVIVQELKRAHWGDDVIVRCREIHGIPCRARIELPLWHCSIEADFAPQEIKTFRISAAAPPVEVNLQEEPLPSG